MHLGPEVITLALFLLHGKYTRWIEDLIRSYQEEEKNWKMLVKLYKCVRKRRPDELFSDSHQLVQGYKVTCAW